MKLNRIEKTVLFISGISAFGIGCLIVFTPHSFYASSGIVLDNDVNLLSELRAPAAGLLTLGIFMLLGIIRPVLAQISIFSTLIVFITFPAGRLISIVFDGMPSLAIFSALVFELVIAPLVL
ncbi:MAG: DUF4345 domain-containing protein [Lentilitoribacter sp.]